MKLLFKKQCHLARYFRFTVVIAVVILSPLLVVAQGEIPVNMYTGTPGIAIDLYTLQDHDLKEPVRLIYSPGDLNLGGNHNFGVGWEISSGLQQVSREVRGLPDDFAGAGSDLRRGWLYNNNYSSVLSFPNTADLSSSTCPDEQADQAFINNLAYTTDTEPDLFSFSVGAVSGHFMFGNDGTIHTIPYQDVKIVPDYANAPSDMTIIGWTITTNDGVSYTLDQACVVDRRLSKSSNDEGGVDETMINLLDRDYHFYSSSVSYTATWMLRTAQSPTGASFAYDYTDKSKMTHTARKAMIFDAQWQINPTTVATLNDFTLMTEHVTQVTKVIASITASSGMKVTCDHNGVKVFDPVRSASTPFKVYQFAYSSIFLNTVTETDLSQCNQLPPYRLYYTNVTAYPVGAVDEIPATDAWGYYNGANNMRTVNGVPTLTSIPTIYVYPNESGADRYRLYPIPSYSGFSVTLNGNANRLPGASAVTAGSLSRLVYPTGGEMDFVFEANKYYDAKAGRDQLGGGIRIKTITYYDGINAQPNIIKNFTYTDASGHSSGKLIARPSFALPVWQSVVPKMGTNASYTKSYSSLGTPTLQWRDLTLITSFNVNDLDYTGGSSVGYSRVTVARPGSGKAVLDYSVPATYGDVSTGSGNTDWQATTMKFARPSSCPPMNIIAGGEAWGYSPFHSAYYDYERGLLLTKSEYNNSGTLVRLTQNSYQYLFKSGAQPYSVTALAYDRFANSTDNIYLYGLYRQPTDVAKVITSETVTTYDENATQKQATEITQYTFGSPYHKYVSKIRRTTPDGTVYGTSLKYTLDYPASTQTPADSTLWMIQMLKTANRNAMIIEQQNSVQPFGGAEKTTGASLVKFRPFNFAKPLMRYVLAFRPSAPVTDFVSSGVASDVFTNDTRYEIVNTINEYTYFDIPLSTTGEDANTAAALWGFDFRVPVAQISQARTISVGFSDFETSTAASFAPVFGTSIFYGKGRTGVNGVHPAATLTRTVVKPGGASKYLLTFWLKNTAGSTVGLQVALKNTSGTALSTNTYNYTLTGNNYQYFTQPIDVSSMPSTFVVEIHNSTLAQPSGSSPSLLPMLDDIAFFPDYASISSITYDLPYGPNAVTDAAGLTAYTTYDIFGRAKWRMDQDLNIRQRFTYTMPGEVKPGLAADIIGHDGDYYIYTPIDFIAKDLSCISGELFEWDFGDGSVLSFTAPSTNPVSPQHQYTTPGTYTVTLRVSHPDYSQPVTATVNITIAYPPLTTTIGASGVHTFIDGVVQPNDIYNDFTNPAGGDNWLTARVMSVGNLYGNTIASYQWQKRNKGKTTWNNTGTNSSQLGPNKVDIVTYSFEWRCIITSSDGRTATTDMISVSVYNNGVENLEP